MRLRGVISAAKARIKNVFYPVPDVPVSKFVLTMKGGKRGLLVNSRDLCARPVLLVHELQSPERQEAEEEEGCRCGCRPAAAAAATSGAIENEAAAGSPLSEQPWEGRRWPLRPERRRSRDEDEVGDVDDDGRRSRLVRARSGTDRGRRRHHRKPGAGIAADAAGRPGPARVDLPACSNLTPGQFFTQAAGHPPVGFTQIIVKHEPGEVLGVPVPGTEVPVGNLKTVLVDLPSGSASTRRRPRNASFAAGASPATCPADTQVGVSSLTATNPLTCLGLTVPPAPVYNIAPRPGEPARFGFSVLGNDIFLNAGIAWESDYHEYFTIHATALKLGAGFELARILKNRLVFDGLTEEPKDSGGRFLTTPSTCGNPEASQSSTRTFLHADSYEEEAPDDSYDVAAPAPPSPAFLAGSELNESPLPRIEGKQRVRPTAAERPLRPDHLDGTGDRPDRLAGRRRPSTSPFPSSRPRRSTTRTSASPGSPCRPGMGVNPSAAPGLQACTDAQFGKGTAQPDRLSGGLEDRHGRDQDAAAARRDPDRQRLPRPAARAATPNRATSTGSSSTPQSAERGISVRLVGNVIANRQTGQLTAVVNEAPQVPFDLGPGQARRRPEGDPDQPADLWAEHDRACDDRLVGLARPGRLRQRLHPHQSSRWRCLRENDGRAALRARLQSRPAQQQGRHLHPLHGQRHPQRRAAGAERRRHHPAAGGDREAGRHPLLLARGARRRGGAQRRRGARKTRAAPRPARSASPASPPAPAPRRCRSTARPTSPAPTRARRSRWLWSPRRWPGPSTSAPWSSASPLFVDPETAQIRAATEADPRRLRRRQARHPLGRRQHQQGRLHPDRDQLLEIRHRRRAPGRRGRPGQSGRILVLRGLRPGPARRTARRSNSGRN